QAIFVSQAAGNSPGSMVEAVQKSKEPRVDWIAELREFVTRSLPSTQSWANPNRRYVWRGLYLPGPVKENVGPGVLAVDCSGSTMPFQKAFANEFGGILKEARPEELVVIYWDAKSSIPESDVERVTPDDFDVDMKPRGFGGTVFQPVLDYVEKEGINPAFMVVLTDLYFTHPTADPGYPVLWACPDYCGNKQVPAIGQVVYIPKED
ncbi:MAG: hypothetical protein KGL39_22435, partial [Patescibacteria group bacterium]|nr:hypothetical protein [Patescibacteria group bacterium]